MILTKVKRDGVNINELINDKLKSGRLSRLLLIVPTNRKLRNLKKELISSSVRKTASVINLETLGTLSNKLLEEYISFIPLTDAAASILIKQSIADSTLEYFSGYRDGIPTGTLERIRRVISEYKRAGVKPEHLLKESEVLSGSEKSKAADIAEIYKHFLKRCNALGVKETGDIYSEILGMNADDFRGAFTKLYPDADLIIIDGFNEFTGPEVDLIERLSCLGKELYLNFDYYEHNAFIFSHLDQCYHSFVSRGFSAIRDLSKETQSVFREAIRKDLFNNAVQKQETFSETISVFSALNREQEIQYIASEIKNLIVHKNVEPHRICLSFNLIDRYSPVVRDTFSNMGIPFNLTDRFSLAKSSPVTTVINYLEILENDFYYKNLFRALSNDQLRIKNIDLSGLIKVSVRKKVIAGYMNWINSINEAIQQLQSDSETDEITRDKELRLYEKARADLEIISEFLNPFTRKMTLGDFLNNFKLMINELGIPLKVLDIQGKEEESIKSVSVFLETMSEIFKLLELEYNSEEKFTLDFFLEQIRTAVISTRYNIKEKSNYGVQVTTFNEIRGLSFDYLFISGLCDGDFPTRYSPEIFFSGTYVRNELIHQTEERYNFYQVLCSWEKGLYLTYPLQDKERELTPSNFLKDFTQLFDVSTINESEFRKRIYSKDEMLKLIGKAGTAQFQNSATGFDYSSLNKAINIDRQRLSDPFGINIYTGNLSAASSDENSFSLSGAALERLRQFGEREFSVTQLEKYAACPYQYFLERILYLNIIEEPSEEFEAFEIGTLVHNILYDFYTEIRKKNIQLAKCPEAQFNQALDLIFRIAEDKIAGASFNAVLSFYDKEAILGMNGDRKSSVLYKFVETERNSAEDFIPVFFEQNFNEVISDEKNSIRVRGKIDRIEINNTEKTFNIVDYKLGGKKPGADEITAGISLQLPLYMFAASRLIKASLEEEFVPADALIYSLKYKAERFGRLSINIRGKRKYEDLDDEEKQEIILKNQELIKNCIDMIIKYTNLIKQGSFHLSTLSDRENKVCRFCDFHSICRIQEAL